MLGTDQISDGETLARITFFVGGTSSERVYKNCYAFFDHKSGHIFVRGYDDDPELAPRAVFSFELNPILENHGEHRLPTPHKRPEEFHREPAVTRESIEAGARMSGRLAPPSALPNDREQEAAMDRFMRAAPPAESHLPERRFLQSEEASADPKVVTLPLETQPEEVERKVEEYSQELPESKFLERKDLPLVHDLKVMGETDGGGVAQSPSKGKKSSTGSHARPKPLKRSGTGGPALSAWVLAVFSLAFRHPMR